MPENSIIAELEKRAQNKDKQTVEHQLCELLGDIIQFSTHHLTRVREFFHEYDDHSVSHSVQVLEYMANLIGKKRLPELSVYDLFFLAAAAYVHDWGMAPTDYEKEVLLLAEEQPLPANIPSISDCKAIIKENENSIFANKKNEALSVEILPKEEKALTTFLAQLYHDYLDFRNGYTEDYRKLSDENDEENKIKAFNQSVRVEYLRQTHAQRSSDYISNWRLPKEPLQSRDLFTALASVVSAHVEPFATVDALDHKKTFPPVDDQDDSNVANLQFCAMLLRIGDVVHFSYDRAPAVIRKEKIFASAYSEKQWQVKKNVTVQVSSGNVRFQASCPTPQQYGFLQTYIGYVNDEIDHFNALALHWPERYQQQLKHVVNQVKAENDAFETRPNLKFTLNQNKIIQLLMGVQLYSDPYTCLRELYQNALDACRCVIPMREHYGENNPRCTIELGVKDYDGGRYLYCLDNGKGMSKHIIEHFFLNIGSSYYKSKEFYTQWAKNGAGFAPTSQFGIGILSCFMLGTRLEVLTKEYEGKDGLIYFGVDGPQEMFYYWSNERIPDEDKEIFSRRQSGTLVKVYLKKEYADNLECGPLEKLELLKYIDTDDNDDIASIEDDKYRNLFNRWQRHIYKRVFNFVQIPFPNIAVQVRVGDDLLPIDPRPSMAKVNLQEYEQDAEMVKRLRVVFGFEWHKNTHSKAYPIVIKRPTYHFHSMLCLPTQEDETFEYNSYESADTCVDGVQIEDSLSDEFGMEVAMRSVGIFNFVGPHKPQITVDRRKFVNEVPINDMEALCKGYVGEVCRITKEHISKYNIPTDSSFYNKIWCWVIEQLPKDSLRLLLMNLFDKEVYPSFDIKTPFATLPLPQLMSMKEIILPYDNVSKYRKDNLFLIKKLSAVKSYTIAENGDLHLTFADPQTMPLFKRNSDSSMVFKINPDSCSVGLPEDKGLFEDYDMVSPFLPLASHRLAKADESSVKLDSGAVLFPDTKINHLVQHLRNKLFGLDDRYWSKIGQPQINSKKINILKYVYYGLFSSFLTGYIPELNSAYSNTESGYSFFGIGRIYCVVKGRLKRAEMEDIYEQVPEEYRYL